MMEKQPERVGERREVGSRVEQDGLQNAGNGGYLRSRVLKRSIVVGRHKTSVSLEDVFWNELRAIAQDLGVHLSQLVARIDAERQHGNLSSAIRLFVFEQSRRRNDAKAPAPTRAI
ncbi:ribbon-helix-helix domain-containing protein [Microbacteriaceae bacterium K1510]|nr:ribbon-helix-helix domain-containing protein [Microbacteriaceae bacterium K1510]